VRVIGAQLDYLLAPEQPDEVLALLSSPDVAHGLAGNGVPRTVFGFVTEALAR
jgi:hypothetical protein